MYSIILSLACFFAGFTLCEAPDKQSRMRDLVIILDDSQETNPSKIGSQIVRLLNVLNAQVAPVLLTAPLWRTFMELRQEWLLRSQISGTIESHTAHYMDALNERINYWYKALEGTGDSTELMSLVADKINEEFFNKETYQKLQKDGKLPKTEKESNIALQSLIAVQINLEAWYWFRLDTGYYLAIPREYAARYTASGEYADILKESGFSPELAPCSVDPSLLDPIQDNELLPIKDTILPLLKTPFLQSKTEEYGHVWSFFVGGHGMCWKSPTADVVKAVVGLPWETFKEICVFFNTYLQLNMLYLSSCYAGGMHRVAFSENNGVYHYPIVIQNLSDTTARIELDYKRFLTADGVFRCTRDFIKKDLTTHTLKFGVDKPECFTKFFEKIHAYAMNEGSDKKAVQDLVYEIFSAIIPSCYIRNTPHILMPQSTSWRLCYCSHMTYLDNKAAILAEVCATPHQIYRQDVFIDALVLKAGLHITGLKAERITFISPRDTKHYLGAVKAVEASIEKVIGYFYPGMDQLCTKHILFESITCQCDPKDPLTQMLGVTENTVTFKDVLMRIVKTEQIELVFTAPNNNVFYATMRSVDNKPTFRNLQKLSEKAITSYRQYYDKTKTELLAQSEEAYAPLRNHYQQALNKGTEAVA